MGTLNPVLIQIFCKENMYFVLSANIVALLGDMVANQEYQMIVTFINFYCNVLIKWFAFKYLVATFVRYLVINK